MKRAASTAVGLTVTAAGWLTVVPVNQFVCLKRLRVLYPELFDGPAASRSIARGIDDHQAVARADA